MMAEISFYFNVYSNFPTIATSISRSLTVNIIYSSSAYEGVSDDCSIDLHGSLEEYSPNLSLSYRKYL